MPSLVLGVGYAVTDFVKTNTYGFALLSKVQDQAVTLTRVRIDDGELEELLPNVGGHPSLFLGDRVYIHEASDPFAEPPVEPVVRSMDLDGSDLRVEDLRSPQQFGASSLGAYYIREDEAYGYTLLHRARGDTVWRAIRQDAHGSLTSSSLSGVVYTETDAEDIEQLYLLRGPTVVPYGTVPATADRILATPAGLAVMTTDADEKIGLWWLTNAETRRRYELPAETRGMVPWGDVVALEVFPGKASYIQPVGPNGPQALRIGVRLGSELRAIDERYVWHQVWDNLFHVRFLRTEWRAFGF